MASSSEYNPNGLRNLSAEDVRAYLIEHPEFWADNAALIERVDAKDTLVDAQGLPDFQSYRMAKLQDEFVALQTEYEDLMELMQQAIQRQGMTYEVIQNLLDIPDFESLIRYVTRDLTEKLDLESVGFFIEAGGWLDVGDYDGLKVVPPGKVSRWMNGGSIVLEEVSSALHEHYGEKCKAVHSQALVRLEIRDGLPPGMLALGHADPMYYATGLATESVECLGGVVERCIAKWV